MIEMIRASMGDMIKNGIKDAMQQGHVFPAATEGVASPEVSLHSSELQTIARDTPYNRRARNWDRQQQPSHESTSVDVPTLLKELEELREQSVTRASGKHKDVEDSSAMDTGAGSPPSDSAEAACCVGSNDITVAKKKQQAGYAPRSSGEAPSSSDARATLREFISSVSVHR